MGDLGTWISVKLREASSSLLKSLGDLWGFLSTSFKEISDTVSSAFYDALTWVKDNIYTPLADFISNLGSNMSKGLSSLAVSVSDGLTWVKDSMAEAFDGAVESFSAWATDTLTGVVESLGKGLESFLHSLISGLSWILKEIVGYITGAISWFKSTFTDFFTDLTNQVRTALIPGSPPQELEEALTGLGRDWQDRVLKEIEAYSRSPITPEDALKAATGIAGVGLGASGLALALGMAADAAHPMKQFGARDAASLLLAYLGVDRTISPIVSIPYETGVLRPLRQFFESKYLTNIPGVSDLITFVVREVITPEEFTETSKLMGFSERWSNAYWESHWRLPSPAYLIDAFHRGIITEGELDKFVVWHDYKPEPRPGISKSDLEIMAGIRKTLIPRVDLRRAWELGAITDEELEKRYRWLGYEDDAPLMANIQKAVAMDAEIKSVASEHVKDFVEGYLSEDELRSKLKELGVPELRLKYMVTAAILRREREGKEDAVKMWRKAFAEGKIEETELRGQLLKLGLQDWKIEGIVGYEIARKKLEVE